MGSLIALIVLLIIAFYALPIIAPIILVVAIVSIVRKKNYKKMETQVLSELGFSNWEVVSYFDEYVSVKSRAALEKYDDIKFFKENEGKLVRAEQILKRKSEVAKLLTTFLENNQYKKHLQYSRLQKKVTVVLENAKAYRINVTYISSAGNKLGEREIALKQYAIDRIKKDPTLLMGKGEYNKYLKEQQKEHLNQKHLEYYGRVNKIIDYANENREVLVIKGSQTQMDNLIGQLFDRTVNSIKKLKLLIVKNGIS